MGIGEITRKFPGKFLNISRNSWKFPGNFPDLMDICPIIENDILKRQINIFINGLQKMNPEIIPDPPVE